MRYDAVIFDKDGVLLDSLSGGYKYANRIRVEELRKRGIETDEEEARTIVRASHRRELERFMDEKGLSWKEVEEIEKRIAAIKNRKIEEGEIRLFPGIENLLESIDASKSVVSNAPWRNTCFTMFYFGIGRYFERVESPSLDDLKTYLRLKKPNPVMVARVIESMEVENPLMVGDSQDDIEVAHNTGIDSCLVHRRNDFEAEPTYEIESIEDLPRILDS